MIEQFSIDQDFINNDGESFSYDMVFNCTFDNDVTDGQWLDVIRTVIGKSPLTTSERGAKYKAREGKENVDNFKITRGRLNGMLVYVATFDSGREECDADFDVLQKKCGIKNENDVADEIELVLDSLE